MKDYRLWGDQNTASSYCFFIFQRIKCLAAGAARPLATLLDLISLANMKTNFSLFVVTLIALNVFMAAVGLFHMLVICYITFQRKKKVVLFSYREHLKDQCVEFRGTFPNMKEKLRWLWIELKMWNAPTGVPVFSLYVQGLGKADSKVTKTQQYTNKNIILNMIFHFWHIL